MKGFDLYEKFRSCVFEISGFTERSWDALEIWERRAWEELHDRLQPNFVPPDRWDSINDNQR